jgi:peroxiredoxin
MRVLQERLGEIEALGASLVAIAPEAPTRAEATAAKNELTHEVLSDTGNVVARAFALVFTLSKTMREIYQGMGIDIPAYNGDDTFELPIPATYAVGKDGIVHKAFTDPDYSKRLEVDDILTALGGA